MLHRQVWESPTTTVWPRAEKSTLPKQLVASSQYRMCGVNWTFREAWGNFSEQAISEAVQLTFHPTMLT